ncbi:MAG: class I SAM-dependent methyltransferase [Deltaproteobacteria bacterium]
MSPLAPSGQLESRDCPLHPGAQDEPVLRGHDRLNGIQGEFCLVRCSVCGLLRTNPRPTAAGMAAYYPDHYAPYLGTKTSANPPRKAAWRRYARGMVEPNTHRLPPLPPGRVLELGCASGAFLRGLVDAGWHGVGIEFSSSAAESARQAGLEVYTGSVETAPEPAAPFDLIVAWMVFEHLHDPLRTLEVLRRWSRPGAWLVLSVPNAGSFEFALFRQYWYALHLPNHLYHYTPATLRAVLHRGGWRVQRVFHQRMLGNLVGSLGHALQGRASFAETLIRLQSRAGWSLHAPLFPLATLLAHFGQTGRMTVWAQRDA